MIALISVVVKTGSVSPGGILGEVLGLWREAPRRFQPLILLYTFF